MTLHLISPIQTYEHLTTRAADVFLANPDISKSFHHPSGGECLDGNPVLIVRRGGQIFVTH